MTSLDWFMTGLNTGLLLAYATVRRGRRHKEVQR